MGDCTYLCFRAALLNVLLRLVSFQARDESLDVLRKLPKLLRHTWGRCWRRCGLVCPSLGLLGRHSALRLSAISQELMRHEDVSKAENRKLRAPRGRTARLARLLYLGDGLACKSPARWHAACTQTSFPRGMLESSLQNAQW